MLSLKGGIAYGQLPVMERVSKQKRETKRMQGARREISMYKRRLENLWLRRVLRATTNRTKKNEKASSRRHLHTDTSSDLSLSIIQHLQIRHDTQVAKLLSVYAIFFQHIFSIGAIDTPIVYNFITNLRIREVKQKNFSIISLFLLFFFFVSCFFFNPSNYLTSSPTVIHFVLKRKRNIFHCN